MIKFGEVRKPLLVVCLSASIAIHCGAVWVIHAHPLRLQRADTAMLMKSVPKHEIIVKDSAELLVDKMEKALEESLNQVIAASHSVIPHQDLAQQEPETKAAEIEKVSLPIAPREELATSMPPLLDPKAEIAFNEPLATLIMPALPTEKMPVISVAEDDYTMTDGQFSPAILSTSQLTPQVSASLQNLKISLSDQPLAENQFFDDLQENTAPQLILPNAVENLRSQWINRSIAETTLPALEYYGLDKIASNLAWHEDLDVEVAFMTDPATQKNIFSLTLHPELFENIQPMRQNFTFIIDRSSSVDKQKLSRFKMAVQRSLAALCEGDTFNIHFIDKYETRLSDTPLAVSPRTIQMAEDFIEANHSSKKPYQSLETLLPTSCAPDEIHSIILVTDGQSLHSPLKQKSLIERLSKKPDQNIHFYTAASGRGNDLVLLDLLSYASGGKLLYSDTNAGFPRKLVQLVKNLHNPILKNLSIEITPSAASATIALHPHDNFLPPLFAGQPYVITGTVDELCDLTLFIQGKNCDKGVNIRKRISLKEAAAGGRSLEKLWAESLSKVCYEHFLENGKTLYLKQAEQIVAPFHGDIAIHTK